MKRYTVVLPVSGKAVIDVMADSEEAAIDMALDSPLTMDNLEEWDVHRHIVRGNVCHAMQFSAEIVDESEEEEA